MDKPAFDPTKPFEPAAEKPAFDPSQPFEATKSERGVVDKLFGVTGERFQTWPERAVKGIVSNLYGAATLPGDAMQGKFNPSPEKPGWVTEGDIANQDAADQQLIHRSLEAASALSPVNPAIRAGDQAIPGIAKAIGVKEAKVPTTRELASAGGADINAATKSDLAISPDAVANFSKLVQQKIGVHPVDAEKTFAKLRELENPPAGSIFTTADLQALRGSLQDTAQNFNPNFAKDQLAATRAIKEFDTFLRGLSPKDVVARPTAAAEPATRAQILAAALDGKREAERVADLFERGRGNYAAAQRSNDITGELDRAVTGILERAEGRAQAAHSGRNLDNTIRSRSESMLEKPKEISGLNDAEIAALEQARDGGAVRNTARELGNRLAGGGGAGSTVLAGLGGTVGASVGGLPGAFIGATLPTGVGLGSRALANALAKRDLSAVSELMRKRSPMYEERLANPETYIISPEKRAALARALMMSAF
ncbi:hypothetical protein [Bradyrhizobium sp. JR18.2]|uniref:hypothetical protein n=1 Tax=Bradyrhizobium sp. JR18.2 TaxID=3156369 RepID=UPI00339A0174